MAIKKISLALQANSDQLLIKATPLVLCLLHPLFVFCFLFCLHLESDQIYCTSVHTPFHHLCQAFAPYTIAPINRSATHTYDAIACMGYIRLCSFLALAANLWFLCTFSSKWIFLTDALLIYISMETSRSR